MADAGKPPPAKRPAVSVPSRSNAFSFATDASPGPVTLASSFFGADPESDCGSFRQLLDGAMGTESGAAEGDTRRNSSALGSASFSSSQVPFGTSHQQVLAEVTAQAAWSSSRMNAQAEYLPTSAETETSTSHPSSSVGISFQQMPTQSSNNKSTKPTGLSFADGQQMNQKRQQTSFNVDKPADDGYNWRKYGQKLVKGSDSPRSYYKCTHPNCSVKKKVQHSLDGHVTEIIYKGQHNHQRPPPGRRTKESNDPNGTMDSTEINSLGISGSSLGLNETHRRDPELGQPTTEQSSCSSDGEDGGDDVGVNEPKLKRRNTDAGPDESDASHKTVTEPRVIVQTTSAVDILDDGYKWRKYGQKVVKGNCHPRSYYKCTYAGCSVRKHVERASTDPKAVITTYEGKHNHDIPPPRNSSHNTASTTTAANVIQPKAHNATNNQGLTRRTEFRGSDQHLNAIQKLKEENHNT